MSKSDRNIGLLHHDMESILSDTEQFLRDLKGQKRVKGSVRHDVRLLRAHLQRLTQHLRHMEAEPSGLS